ESGCMSFFHVLALDRLDQHCAALATADALRGNPALEAEPMHGIDEMKHNAIAACADRMPDADCAAVDVEAVAWNAAGSARKAKRIAAEFVVFPGRKATKDLRGERLVQFPQLDIAECVFVPLQDFGRTEHWPKAHDRGIKRRPFAVENDGLR